MQEVLTESTVKEHDPDKTVKIKFNPKNWNIKIEERTRDRMKLIVKLNKEEATAFKNFTDTVKPENVELDDFVKKLFLIGIEKFNSELMAMARKYAEENKEKLEKEGVKFTTPSDVTPTTEVIQ